MQIFIGGNCTMVMRRKENMQGGAILSIKVNRFLSEGRGSIVYIYENQLCCII